MRLQLFLGGFFTAAFLAFHAAHGAAPIAYDSFNFPVGAQLNGQPASTGFMGTWVGGNAPTAFTIAPGSLVDPTGLMQTSGNHITSGTTSLNKDVRINLSTTFGAAGTTEYFSWLMEPEGTIGAGYSNGYFGLLLTDSAGVIAGRDLFVGRTGSSDPGAPYQMETVGGTDGHASTVVPVSGQPVLMVLRADFATGNDTFKLYINPSSNGNEPATPSAVKSDLDIGTVSSIFLGGPGAFSVDELRVGATYQSVTTSAVPEPQSMLVCVAALAMVGTLRHLRSR